MTSGRAIERAARGGRLDPAQFLEIAETLDAVGAPGDVARRRAPAAPARPGPRGPRPAGAAEHARPQLRSRRRAARHRLAPARRASGGGPGRLRPPPPAAGRARRLGARLVAPGADRHAPQRALRGARSRPTPGHGSRASSTTPRAAARRCSSSRSSSSSWATPGARRRSPSRRRSSGSSTSSRRSSRPTRRSCARRSTRWPGSTSGRPRRSFAAELDAVRAETADRPEVVLLGARHPGPVRPGRAHRHPPRRRLHGARRHRPQHRRQDRDAAHARPARAHAPGRAAGPGRGRQPAADLPRRLRRHRRRAVDRPEPLDVQRPPQAITRSSRPPGRARSCCSTSWAPARTRPRARRWPRRCSTTSSGPARSSRPRPTTPS